MKKPGTLHLCGLGVNRLRDLTLASLEAIKSCHFLYYIHTDAEKLRPWLASLGPDLRLEASRLSELSDAERTVFVVRRICRDLKAGKNVAYLTYGHPLFFSDGRDVAQECRRRGHRCRVLPAVSAVDSIACALWPDCDLGYGYCAAHAADVLDRGLPADAEQGPLVIFGADGLSGPDFQELTRTLALRFPPQAPVYGIRCADGLNEPVAFQATVATLPERAGSMIHLMSLALPGAGQSKRRPERGRVRRRS